MMKYKTLNRLIFLIFISIAVSSNTATNTTLKECLLLVKQFSAAFEDPDAYLCNACFVNSGELARRLSVVLKDEIELADLSIAIVKHKRQNGMEIDRVNLRKRILGVQTRTNNMIIWSYHAFAFYKGLVLDLDYNGGVELFLPYYAQMFRRMNVKVTKKDEPDRYVDFNNPKEMEIALFPAQQYLQKFRGKRANPVNKNEQKEVDSIISSADFLALEEFIKRYLPVEPAG